MIQDWFSVSCVLDYLGSLNIEYEFDKFGLTAYGEENTHIDIYDGMMYKNGEWIIDWENSPECKTEDIKDLIAGILKRKDWEKNFSKFIKFVDGEDEE